MAGRMFAAIVASSLLYSCTSALQPIVSASVSGYDDRTVPIFELQSIRMDCTVANLPENIIVSSYQWIFTKLDGTISDIEAAILEGKILTINTASYFNHLGSYMCRITLSTEQQYDSNSINLVAKFAGIFPVNNLDTVSVLVNETVTLECVAVVPPNDVTARIGWQKKNSASDDYSTIHPHAPGNSVLHIEHVMEVDAGMYKCSVITDNSGQQDAEIQLVVVTVPMLTATSSLTEIFIGTSHSLVCGPVVSATATNFTWYLNGRLLDYNDRLRVESNGQSSTLYITTITYAEAGLYKCAVSNIAGITEQLTTLRVRGPPQITLFTNQSSVTIPRNTSALLHCPYVAWPSAMSVVWMKAGQTLLSDGIKYRIFDNGTTLELLSTDSGNYTCRVDNAIGTDNTIYTVLVIDAPAQPYAMRATFQSEFPQSVFLFWIGPLEVVSQPRNKYLMLLQPQQEGELPKQVELAANSTSIELAGLFPGESYTVLLHAVNTVGSSMPSIGNFTLPISSPSLNFDVIALLGGHSLCMKWQLLYDGGPSILKFNVTVYAMDYDTQLLVYSSNLDLHISQDSELVLNLEPATSYAVEVFISNGMMEDNQVIIINTTMAPPSQPSTPTITLTTTHIFQITFTVEEGSSPITDLLLNTTQFLSSGDNFTTQEVIGINDAVHVDSVVDLSGGEKKVVLVVGGLHQLNYYTFQVAAVSIAGKGVFSDSSSPTTLEDGHILYYIVFSVVGGAVLVFIVTIVVAVVMLRTTRRIQRTKRTLSINGNSNQRGILESFIAPTSHTEQRRSSNHSLQLSSLNGLHDCTSPINTPLSSVSDYKHHMLSSSVNGVPLLYDRLSNYRKGSECSNYDKRTGSVSSDEAMKAVTESCDVDSEIVIPIDNNGVSAIPSTGKLLSSHSLFLQPRQLSVPTSLHQLPLTNQGFSPEQHLLCPPGASSPAINYRYSRDSILDKPTSYMTDV